MSTGRMMSMCEHAKIYGKCDVCLRAEIDTLVATMEEAKRLLEEARLQVARMLPWQTLSDAQERTIEVLSAKVERMTPIYEAVTRACPITSADGWMMCQFKAGHGGECELKDISLAKDKS